MYDKHGIKYISKIETSISGKTKHPLAPPLFAPCAINLDMTKVSAIANDSIGSSHMLKY